MIFETQQYTITSNKSCQPKTAQFASSSLAAKLTNMECLQAV
jgi:hypothetical protein